MAPVVVWEMLEINRLIIFVEGNDRLNVVFSQFLEDVSVEFNALFIDAAFDAAGIDSRPGDGCVETGQTEFGE